MARAFEPADSKSNDSNEFNLNAADIEFWRSLEKSNEKTFAEILSITQTTAESTFISEPLTVGIFHDPKYFQQYGEYNAHTRDALVEYTIFNEKEIPLQLRSHWITECTQYSLEIDRSVGCMVGMAIGDAVGHPLEFVDVTDLLLEKKTRPRFDSKSNQYFNEFNRFKLERGQWTDDASMGLCIADSLILKEQYDGRFVV